MFKIFGITGPSGCGKDTAALYLANKFNANYVKLCTTRPKRNDEDNGYHFVSDNEFIDMVMDGTMLSAQVYRGWGYGLMNRALSENQVNILPMSDGMVEQMVEEGRKDIDLKIIYLTTSPKERLAHILSREEYPDCYEICRRFMSDKDDYEENIELHGNCAKHVCNDYTDEFYNELSNLYISYYDKDRMD